MNPLHAFPTSIPFCHLRLVLVFGLGLASITMFGGGTAFAEAPTKGQREVKRVERDRSAAIAKGDISFDDIKFEIEPGQKFEKTMLTETIKSLEGKDVTIRGWILPSILFKQTGIKQFVLVRDNKECCFGPKAALFDCLVVKMAGSHTTDFTPLRITVTGKFRFKEWKYPDDSGHLSVFEIQATSAK
ncbi:MAG: hypothetical protein AAFP69_10525 [Planctomycetota bacterium]